AGPGGPHVAARPASAGEQPAASASGPSHVRLRCRGHLRVRRRWGRAEDPEGGRGALRAARRAALDVAQSEQGPAHEGPSLHGGRPEEPEHGGRKAVTRGGSPGSHEARIAREITGPVPEIAL